MGGIMNFRGYAATLMLALMVVLAVASNGYASNFVGSFVWLAVVVMFPLWALYSVVRIIIRPAERRRRGIRLGIWITTIAILVAVTGHWDAVARREADAAVAAVVAYRNRSGLYPASLGAVGVNAQQLKERYSLSYRLTDTGQPRLLYCQPSMPLVAHHYDFERRQWFRRD